jgi:AraC-like DNA-binding protein
MAVLECEKDLKRLSSTDIIEEINDRLSSVPSIDMNLKAMAQYLNMSVSTLQRRLVQQNTTFKQIKSRHRLDQGKHLLHHSQYSIDHIAAVLGYSDSSNFSKAFKTQTGLTPKGYRKEHK